MDTSASLVEACRRAGLTRDRGVYRLRRLSKGYGRAVVHSRRGGSGHGRSALTSFGRSLLARAFPRREPSGRSNRFTGTYHAGPPARVHVAAGVDLVVAFRAGEGERLRVSFEPDALLLARRRFSSSARNVFRTRVQKHRRVSAEELELTLSVGSLRLRAAVTPTAAERLRLVPGSEVWAYLKATALRRELANFPGARV
ncbi:MAG: TOBE domain-containing protein [Thermoplasmata archaeon]|nr:TOBE domain-containing protein [Thermoplasmata archaeon]